jgi:hypothetical protein
MEYPAISLHQPYASLIAIGAKPFETRGRRPPLKHIGKRIAIQAAKRPCLVDMDQEVADDITEAFGFCNWNHRLPRGVVVCTAKLVGAYRCGELRGRGDLVDVVGLAVGSPVAASIPFDRFGNYKPGRWAWLLTDVQTLDPPVPAVGNRGWFVWHR